MNKKKGKLPSIEDEIPPIVREPCYVFYSYKPDPDGNLQLTALPITDV